MKDVLAKAIAVSIILFLGYLFKKILDKLNVYIKQPLLFSFLVCCFGMGVVYLGYIVFEKQGAGFLSYSLFIIGAIPWIIGGSVGFYTVFNPPPQEKSLKDSKTETIVASITQRVLAIIFRNKSKK